MIFGIFTVIYKLDVLLQEKDQEYERQLKFYIKQI